MLIYNYECWAFVVFFNPGPQYSALFAYKLTPLPFAPPQHLFWKRKNKIKGGKTETEDGDGRIVGGANPRAIKQCGGFKFVIDSLQESRWRATQWVDSAFSFSWTARPDSSLTRLSLHFVSRSIILYAFLTCTVISLDR